MQQPIAIKAQLPSFDLGSSDAIDYRQPGKSTVIRKYSRQRAESTSASHKTGLRTGAASIPGHNRKTALSSAPTADACYRVWPTPLGTAGSTAVGPDRPETPTSSARRTPPTGVDNHDQNCARSGSLDFLAC